MPLIDPKAVRPRPTPVTLADSRTLTAIDDRARPHGYLVLRGRQGGRRTSGAERSAVREVEAACRIAVEAYDVERLGTVSRRRSEAINPDQSMRVTIRPATIDVPAGALFVPMNQPAAGIVAAALEPDSPGSYVGVGIMPMERRRERGAGLSRDGGNAVLRAALGLLGARHSSGAISLASTKTRDWSRAPPAMSHPIIVSM